MAVPSTAHVTVRDSYKPFDIEPRELEDMCPWPALYAADPPLNVNLDDYLLALEMAEEWSSDPAVVTDAERQLIMEGVALMPRESPRIEPEVDQEVKQPHGPNCVWDYPSQPMPNHDAWPTIWLPEGNAESEGMQTDICAVESSPFLSLPYELRELIYSHYFNTSYPLENPEYSIESYEDMWIRTSFDDEMDGVSPPDPTLISTTIDFGGEDITGLKVLMGKTLLRVNRQIRQEALPIAIQGKCWFTDNVRAFPRLFQCLGGNLLTHIVELRIEDPFFPCTYEYPDSRYPNSDAHELYGDYIPCDLKLWATEDETYAGYKVPSETHIDPDIVTSSSQLWKGDSYPAYLLKTIALLPRLRHLSITLDFARCPYEHPYPIPSLRGPATVYPPIVDGRRWELWDSTKCPSMNALRDLGDANIRDLTVGIEPVYSEYDYDSSDKLRPFAEFFVSKLGVHGRRNVKCEEVEHRLQITVEG